VRADVRFQKQGKAFWAHVRSISEALGYTDRSTKKIRTLTQDGILKAFRKLGLSSSHLVSNGELSPLGANLCSYFEYRAAVLNDFVEPRLMNADQAKELYDELKQKLQPSLAETLNKQSGEMKQVAYLTGLVNMIVESVVGADGFNSNPGQLTTFTSDQMPLRTLSRRVDGALPGVVNPIALWEIKEYYYTTTFGSRVADGVYETLLDGMELEEMREHEGRSIDHVLIIDAHFTWWVKGRSYLCRIIDMLHMGYVDEVIFGREVSERLPALAVEWKNMAENIKVLAEPQLKGDVEADT